MNRGVCQRCGGNWRKCWRCQAATLSVQGGNVIVDMDCHVLSQKTLTDDERAAIEWAVSAARNVDHPDETTLRKLLERTK